MYLGQNKDALMGITVPKKVYQFASGGMGVAYASYLAVTIKGFKTLW